MAAIHRTGHGPARTGAPHYPAFTTRRAISDEANLDGLRIGGHSGWECAEAELCWREAGEVFAAGCLALETGESRRVNAVLEIAYSKPALQRGLISAIGWTTSDFWKEVLPCLLNSPDPAARRIGIAGYAVRREEPAQSWDRLIADDAPDVRARTLRAAGELGKVELLPELRRAVTDHDEPSRFWAAWSAARLSDRSREVVQALQEFACRSGVFQDRAMGLVVRVLDMPAAKSWLLALAKNPTMLRTVAIGIGSSGDPSLADALFSLMRISEVARVAGEAFTLITGVDLGENNLEQDVPADFPSGPNDDPADDNVALDPDENLAWPNPSKIQRWWNQDRGELALENRHLLGKRVTSEWLVEVLRIGFQRQRAAAALELALAQPDRSLFEVRAPAFRQHGEAA